MSVPKDWNIHESRRSQLEMIVSSSFRYILPLNLEMPKKTRPGHLFEDLWCVSYLVFLLFLTLSSYFPEGQEAQEDYVGIILPIF